MSLGLQYKNQEHIFDEKTVDGVPFLSYPMLEETGIVHHGFSTKLGGVSKGCWATMNISTTRGDDPEDVEENQRRIARAIGVKPEDMTGFAERIYNEASRLITLVEDIIKLSKLDEGNVELEKEEVDLYKLTREILTRLSPQAAKRKVHVEVTGEPVEYVGIRQILDEMIYNICENAIKYNKEGGKLTVWVGNTLQGKKICVTDTGIGIPENETDRIFERFYRVDKSHSKETGGTGLGLSIVKHGAMLHGAKIHVDSKLGEGTKIELIF